MITDTAILLLLADLQRTIEAQRAEIAALRGQITEKPKGYYDSPSGEMPCSTVPD